MIMTRRTAKKYLDVRYADRDMAKRLGARWDPSVQRWYCPAGSPLATVLKWRAERPAEAIQLRPARNENFELPLAV